MPISPFRTLVLLGVALLGAACGTPMSPSGATFTLTAGAYRISFSGVNYVVTGGAIVPVCTQSGPGFVPSYAAAQLDLTFTSGKWRGLPQSDADGQFEMEFTPTSAATASPSMGGVSVKATGSMLNSSNLPLPAVFPSRIIFADATTLTGTTGRDYGSGTVSSAVSFTNDAGSTLTCNPGTVHWFMFRLAS